MKTQSSLKIKKKFYNAASDILHIRFQSDRGNSYGSVVAQDIEVLRDMDTDQTTGLIVFSPRLKLTERQARLTELGYDIDLAALISIADYLREEAITSVRV